MHTRMTHGPLRLLGDGAALPGPPIPTDDLLRRIEDRFGIPVVRKGTRIGGRLGIKSRHFSRDFIEAAESPRPADTNPKLCAAALRQALAQANIAPQNIGYLLAHTTTPHTLLPSNVAWVADELQLDRPTLELRQACCGFASALQIAAAFLAQPGSPPVAILGSETGSVYLDPRCCDRNNAQLVNLLQMGDGAGAVVLGSDAIGSKGALISHMFIGSLGANRVPAIRLDVGGSSCTAGTQPVIQFQHDFQGVREGGLELLQAGVNALRQVDVHPRDVDYFLTHQASAAIPRLFAPMIGVDPRRFIVDCDTVGNLGSASIWVALQRLRSSGRLREGERVMVLGAEASKYLFGGFIYRHAKQGTPSSTARLGV